MPYYDFLNEKTGEIIELFFHMNEKKQFIDNDGYEWLRQMSIPNASIDTVWNPDSKADFSAKSGSKKGTLGDIMDKAAELSNKRAERTGKDPVKQAYYDSYAKTRDGKRHPEERKSIAKELTKNVIEKINIKLKKK